MVESVCKIQPRAPGAGRVRGRIEPWQWPGVGWGQGGGLDGSAGNPGFLNGNLSRVCASHSRASLSWRCPGRALNGSLGCTCVGIQSQDGLNPAPAHPTRTCKGKGLLKISELPHRLCPFFIQTFPKPPPGPFLRPLPISSPALPFSRPCSQSLSSLTAAPLPSSSDPHRGRQSHQRGSGDLPAAGAAPPALPAPPLQAGAGRYSSHLTFPLPI